MLVFISDLHMTDKTSGMQFVPVEAFQRAFGEIAQHAINAGSAKVELIFLGDVFDLVRTTQWFDIPLAERPWGDPNGNGNSAAAERHALELLNFMVTENAEVFEFLQAPEKTLPTWAELIKRGVTLTRVYLPGNHDRICNQFPSLRTRVSELLCLQRRDPAAPFPNIYKNPKYRTFARHGHEFDTWNIELSSPPPMDNAQIYPWGDYLKIPIGELIACELASKLAPACAQVLTDRHYPKPNDIANQLRTVDDVRPVIGIVPWLFDRLHHFEESQQDDVLEAVKTGVNEVLHSFGDIPFVRRWIETHDTISPVDPASLLKDILFLGERIPIAVLKPLMPLFQKASALRESDNLAGNAISDFDRLDALDRGNPDALPYLYVLYGHTHLPQQVPIEVLTQGDQPRVYLNTGTWRPSHQQGIKGKGFISWKGMTYSMIYHPDDDPLSQSARQPFQRAESGDRYPTFEVWTGALEEHPITAEAAGNDKSDTPSAETK